MPFLTINAPNLYSATMSNFKDEWDKIFIIQVKSLSYTYGEPVRVTEPFEIIVGKQKITSGIKTIIDAILLYCSKKPLIILYS